MGHLDHVEVDPLVQQPDLQFLGVVGEDLQVDRRMGGDDAFPGGAGQVRVEVVEPFHPEQRRLAVARDPLVVVAIEQLQVLQQRLVDLLVVGQHRRIDVAVAENLARRLALGALVVEAAVGDQLRGQGGEFRSQVRTHRFHPQSIGQCIRAGSLADR